VYLPDFLQHIPSERFRRLFTTCSTWVEATTTLPESSNPWALRDQLPRRRGTSTPQPTTKRCQTPPTALFHIVTNHRPSIFESLLEQPSHRRAFWTGRSPRLCLNSNCVRTLISTPTTPRTTVPAPRGAPQMNRRRQTRPPLPTCISLSAPPQSFNVRLTSPLPSIQNIPFEANTCLTRKPMIFTALPAHHHETIPSCMRVVARAYQGSDDAVR
jgi:hypothetical protein